MTAPTRSGVVARDAGPSGWLAAPALLCFLAFAVVPLGVVLYLSMTNWNAIGTPTWVGAENWERILADPQTWNSLWLSVKLVVLCWLVQTPLSILLGAYVAGHQKPRAAMAAIFFIPLILSSAAIGIAFKAMLDPNFGLGASTGLPFLQQDWLGNQDVVLLVVVFITAWQFVPFHTLLYQGGIRQIPASLYEAAELDGAGRVQQFLQVTLPQLRNTIVTSSTLMIVGSLTYFDVIFVLSAGVPSSGLQILPVHMYITGFSANRMGDASVLAVILALFGLALALILTRMSGFTKMTSQQEGM